MFFENCNALKEAKVSAEVATKAETASKNAIANETLLAETTTRLIKPNTRAQKYKDEVAQLKLQKAQLVSKLEKEINDNIHLHTG